MAKLISLIVLVAGVATILFYYRRGGVVDSIYRSALDPGLRDMGIYMQAAQDLLARKSPYSLEDLAFRSGTFGVIFFAVLGNGAIGFFVSQILNFVGFAYFTFVMFRFKMNSQGLLLLASIAVWFSCLREVFSTGQITGIIAGLLAWGFQTLKTESFRSKIYSGLAFALTLDLKPNLVLFFVFACYIFFRKVRDIWIPFSILIGGHLLVDLYSGVFLEKEWLAVLASVSNPDRDPTNTGTRTIWPIIRLLFGGEMVTGIFPTLVFLGLGMATAFYVNQDLDIRWVHASLLVPVTYNYFHLYSFFPIAVLTVGIAISRRRPWMLAVSVPFLLISGANFQIKHVFFSILICSYITVMLKELKMFSAQQCKIFFITSSCIILLRYIVVTSIGAHYIVELLILNFLVLIGALVLFKSDANTITRGRVDD